MGFDDGDSRATQNLDSVSLAIYDPIGALVSLQGICLGSATNYIAEYSALVELLSKSISLRVWALVV